ncbi:MAG: hypothetical protein BWX47_01998 [candidate division Hyd24-12 bacterium ADurb.Bin004]|nr:MAG: hypothetical protein BWX47_01998 [candidate division Hyd24-12 bacterium ADurb.Bin004]
MPARTMRAADPRVSPYSTIVAATILPLGTPGYDVSLTATRPALPGMYRPRKESSQERASSLIPTRMPRPPEIPLQVFILARYPNRTGMAARATRLVDIESNAPESAGALRTAYLAANTNTAA